MPVLYRRPRALEPGRYGSKSLGEIQTFDFARGTNSVPVNAVEFPNAMRSYPIVFTAAEPLAALAVLGSRDGQNLFVTESGKWLDDAYVPAYVKRYPFIFVEHDGGNQLVLCVDDASNLIIDGNSRPLFIDGAPSEVVREGLAACGEYQTQYNITREFIAALQTHQLLVSSQIQISTPGNENLSLAGFRVVDQVKFNALPDEVFLAWRKRGWLPLVYCHLMSLMNWGRIASLTAAKRA